MGTELRGRTYRQGVISSNEEKIDTGQGGYDVYLSTKNNSWQKYANELKTTSKVTFWDDFTLITAFLVTGYTTSYLLHQLIQY